MRSFLIPIFVILCSTASATAGDFLAYVQVRNAPALIVSDSILAQWQWDQEKTVVFVDMRPDPVGSHVYSRFMVRADSISVTHLPGGNDFLIAAERYDPPKNTMPTTIYEVHLFPKDARLGVRIVHTIQFPWQFIDDTKGHVCRGIQTGPDGTVWEMRRGPYAKQHIKYIDVAAIDWAKQKVLGRCRLYPKDIGMAGMPEPLDHAVIFFTYPNFKQTTKNGMTNTYFGKLRTLLIMENGHKHVLRLAPKLPDKPFRCVTVGDKTTGITDDGKEFVSFSINSQGKLLNAISHKIPLKTVYPKYIAKPKSQWAPRVYVEDYIRVSAHESVALVRYGSQAQKLIYFNAANGSIIRVQAVKTSIQWIWAWHGHLFLINETGSIIPWSAKGQTDAAFGNWTEIAGISGPQR